MVCGHHSRGGTTPAALTLRTLGASSSLGAALTALVRTIALTLAATAALALLSSLVRAISTRSRTAAWARCRAVTATSGERVVGYPRRTSARLRSWLGHGARHSAAFRRGCGAITGTSSTSAECGRTRLRGATRSVTRTGFRGAGFSRTRLRAGLWRTRRRCAGAGLSSGSSRLRSACLGGGTCRRRGLWCGGIPRRRSILRIIGALVLGRVVLFHLLHHRGFDGRRCGLHKLALFLQRGEQFFACYTKLFCKLMYT